MIWSFHGIKTMWMKCNHLRAQNEMEYRRMREGTAFIMKLHWNSSYWSQIQSQSCHSSRWSNDNEKAKRMRHIFRISGQPVKKKTESRNLILDRVVTQFNSTQLNLPSCMSVLFLLFIGESLFNRRDSQISCHDCHFLVPPFKVHLSVSLSFCSTRSSSSHQWLVSLSLS